MCKSYVKKGSSVIALNKGVTKQEIKDTCGNI